MMQGFDHILNWKLKTGSHPFPGPDGGTCINEAALVAMGFKYRPIRHMEDMPNCFSRPICRLAMLLNDEAKDDNARQRLLPFVTRLACADSAKVERERASYIQAHMTYPLDIERGIKVLEGALAIGWQAKRPAPDIVRTRMDAAKAKATTATSKPDSSLFGKVTTWLTTGKALEPTD
jgi:hypothetical protein